MYLVNLLSFIRVPRRERDRPVHAGGEHDGAQAHRDGDAHEGGEHGDDINHVAHPAAVRRKPRIVTPSNTAHPL